jgi:hypothetical protein
MIAHSSPLHLIFVVAFMLCEAFAAFLWQPPAEPYRVRLVALGLFFFGLSLLL